MHILCELFMLFRFDKDYFRLALSCVDWVPINKWSQIASSFDEIMHFYAQAIEFNMFYLFYVSIGFNLL